MSAAIMKNTRTKGKANKVDIDEILPEYDFSRAKPNNFAARYAAGSKCCGAGTQFALIRALA
jgi:hypothetical protein